MCLYCVVIKLVVVSRVERTRRTSLHAYLSSFFSHALCENCTNLVYCCDRYSVTVPMLGQYLSTVRDSNSSNKLMSTATQACLYGVTMAQVREINLLCKRRQS